MHFSKHPGLICIFLLASVLLQHCSSTQSAHKSANTDLNTLAVWMTGDFSSQEQSLRDSAFFDIRLHIRPIWPNRTGEIWLYVEQATAAAEAKPYRQRVYKLEREGDVFKSIVYTLPEPERWAGAYKTPEMFQKLKPEDLALRDGCTVFLQKKSREVFEGATRGEGCESNIRGAKWARSTVTITANQLLSWDQGFNASGEQVWGAVKGGYIFVKQ